MRYEVYVDRLFVLHFGMNLLLLYLTAGLGGYRAGIRRLMGAAAAGSILFLALFLIPMGRAAWLFKTAMLTAGTAGMLQAAFRLKGRQALIRAGLLYIAAACVLGGALGAVRGIKNESVMEILIPAAAAVLSGTWLIRRERQRRKDPLWTAVLREGEKSVAVTALMDSGNSLYDPVSQRPVCVAQREVLEGLGLLQKPEKFRLIPYHSVGKKHGLLQAAVVKEMYLQKEGQERRLDQVLVAVSEQRLSAKGRYQLLLHPALLEEKKGENHDIEGSDAGKDAV